MRQLGYGEGVGSYRGNLYFLLSFAVNLKLLSLAR